MLSFVQSWFAPATAPIGVDFGSDCLRMAQVELIGNEHHLVAAAKADVPTHVRNDPAARFAFFAETVRDLLTQNNFRGRRVVLSLPASLMHIQHLRVPKMDEEALKKGLVWEARGKLPFDPTQAVLRHLIAGEVYHDQEPKYEVILLAARRDLVDQYLAAANKAKLTIASMNVEPKATVDCFSHIYRRQSDVEATTCYVDIGCTATRATIAKGGKIQFARVIPIGGEHFSRAVATAFRIPLEQARQMRLQVAESSEETAAKGGSASPAAVQEPAGEVSEAASLEGTGFSLLNAGVAAAERRESTSQPAAAPEPQPVSEPQGSAIAPDNRRKMDEACHEPLSRLIEELSLCRRYFEAAFHEQPVQRLLFIGGEANQRGLCQRIAREMGIAAQVGDPLCRMSKHTLPGVEIGIDRRIPQPGWTIAIGLSMGPAADAAKPNVVESEARASR